MTHHIIDTLTQFLDPSQYDTDTITYTQQTIDFLKTLDLSPFTSSTYEIQEEIGPWELPDNQIILGNHDTINGPIQITYTPDIDTLYITLHDPYLGGVTIPISSI